MNIKKEVRRQLLLQCMIISFCVTLPALLHETGHLDHTTTPDFCRRRRICTYDYFWECAAHNSECNNLINVSPVKNKLHVHNTIPTGFKCLEYLPDLVQDSLQLSFIVAERSFTAAPPPEFLRTAGQLAENWWLDVSFTYNMIQLIENVPNHEKNTHYSANKKAKQQKRYHNNLKTITFF